MVSFSGGNGRIEQSDYIPDEGDIVWVNLSPASGHEQKGRRPALVLTPAAYNKKAKLCFVVPVASSQKGYPFEVLLPSGMHIAGVVLCDQGKTIDWVQRCVEFVDKASLDVLEEVREKIKILLNIK